jgi:hypothetical protein
MRILVALLCWLLAGPAWADITLFDDGDWRVIGVDAGAEPLPIAVTKKDEPLGSFAALRFFYALDAGFVPVLTLYASGASSRSCRRRACPARRPCSLATRLRRRPHLRCASPRSTCQKAGRDH